MLLLPGTARALPQGPTGTVQPPALTESFPATWVAHGGTIAMQFRLSNPNQATPFATSGFADTLPAGLILANPVQVSGTCISTAEGTVSSSPGGQQFQVSGATLAPSSSCTVSVNVVGTVSGRQTNTTGAPVATFLDEAGQQQTISGAPASTPVIVLLAPFLHTDFGLPSVPVHGITTLRFRVRNPALNPVALTGVAFTDQLPARLSVASPSFPVNTCGGILQAAPGSSEIQLSGATVARGSECLLSVQVIADSEGSAGNVAGPVFSADGGVGNTAQALLDVVMAPQLSIQVRPGWLYSGNNARIQLTITNPNLVTSLNIIVFYVHLSPRLTVADHPNVVSDCDGGSVTANPGDTTMRFLHGLLPAGSSCQVAVTLRALGVGVKHIETTRIAAVGTVPGNRAVGQLTIVPCPAIKRSTSHRRRRHQATRASA